MFTANGIPILASELDVLNTLKADLTNRGILRFRVFRQSKDDIMTNCPFHSGGQERKPSFGINLRNGACHCFTCGYSGDITDMISRLYGYNDEGHFGARWLLKNFVSMEVEERPPLNLDMQRRKKVQASPQVFVSEEELDSYRYIHPYMYERGLTDEIISDFDIGYDIHTNCITFPVADISGKVVFVARRSVATKFFKYPEDVKKPVYAADKVLQKSCKKVVITESFFNALTCWRYGIPAVSLMGLGTDYQMDILRNLPVRHYVLGLDPDSAGNRAARKIYDALSCVKLVTRYDIPEGYDINDLGEQVKNLREY